MVDMATFNSSNFVFFGPKANCTLDLCPIENSVYTYRPSLAANSTFIALFGIAMIVHIILGIRWRSWWFLWCMLLGCADEITGYVGRIMLWYNPWNFNGFMIQIVTITTGPVFFCAAIYVTLAKSIQYFSPSLSRFNPRLFYWVFIPLDIVSLVLQGAGGALSTTSSGTSQTGVNIALAGLSFQVFTLVVFSGLFIDYMARYLRSVGGSFAGIEMRTKLFFGFLTTAIVVTLIRCAYRVNELSQGYSGPLIAEENLFIGLEGVLIVISVFALCIGHPGFVFKEGKKEDFAESSAESGMAVQEK